MFTTLRHTYTVYAKSAQWKLPKCNSRTFSRSIEPDGNWTKNEILEDRRPAISAVIATLLVLSSVSVLVRLYARRFLTERRIGWDDVWITIAMLPAISQALLQLMATKYGLGLHGTDVSPDKLVPMLQLIWWSGITFNLSHLFIKFSYLAFYCTLAIAGRVILTGIGFVVAVGITFTTLSIFMCTPIQRAWDQSVLGKCVDESTFLFSNAAFNMVADIAIFIMPIPTLWNLQMPLKRRLILTCMLTCGSVVLVASGVRIKTIFELLVPPTQDPTWDLVPLLIWAEIEVNSAIILSCTPAFKALVSRLPGHMKNLISGLWRKNQSAMGISHSPPSDDNTELRVLRTRTEVSTHTQQDGQSFGSREHIVYEATSV